jgi:hypothetical protein
MSLRARLARLEKARQAAWGRGRCPQCPPAAIVEVDQDGNLLSGAYPEPCRRCGGPHEGVSFIEVRLTGVSSSMQETARKDADPVDDPPAPLRPDPAT